MRLGRRDQVPPLFEQAAKVDPKDTRAWEHLAMSFFGAGRSTDAYALAKDLLDQDPTLLIPQGILAMKDPTKPGIIFEAVLQFLGEADFELAEAQMAFEGLGMPRVAFMFTVPLMAPPLRSIYSPSPMQHFYSCALALMTSSAPTAKKIEELLGDWSADKRFPSRIESVQVLELLKQSHPGDGRFALMRGNALANLGRISEATAEWESAIQKDPSLAQAHRNLGLYFWKEKKDLKRADAFYRRAIDLDPKGQTLYSELSSILSETPEEVVALLEKLGTDQFRLNELSERLAQAYNDLGEYPRTIAFLEKRVFSNWEARTTSRNLWVRALIERGKKAYEGGDLDAGLRDFEAALTYPRNLGVGRPAEPEEAEALYWCGMTYLKLGKAAEAKSAFEQGSLGDGGGETQKEYRMKCSEELLKQP